MRVGFVGMSHLGQVYSAATAAAGVDVLLMDDDADLVDRLLTSPTVHEPGLDSVWRATASQRTCTTEFLECRNCDLVLITRDVPTSSSGESDMTAIERLVNRLFQALAGSSIPVVVLSQVAPGTTRRWLDSYPDLTYQVETLVFGNALDRATNPERHIIGREHSGGSLHPMHEAWLAVFPAERFVMSFESAEMTKIAINIYLAASVCTTNTIAELARSLGAQWDDIVPALRSDRRIGEFAYLTPGLGLSGGNIERDLASFIRISGSRGVDNDMISALLRSSAHHRQWVSRQLRDLPLSDGSTIALLGLAYKAETASTKNSPSIAVLEEFPDYVFRVHDPSADFETARTNVQRCESWEDAVRGADCLLVMTPWDMYRTIDGQLLLRLMRGRRIIDPHSVLAHESRTLTDVDYRSLRRLGPQ